MILSSSLITRPLTLAIHNYAARLRQNPQVKPLCREIHQYLKPIVPKFELSRQLAGLFSALRDDPSMFVQVETDHSAMAISATGILGETASGPLPSSSLSYLMARALINRQSVHLPSVVGVERVSIWSRYLASGGASLYSLKEFPVVFYDLDLNPTLESAHNDQVLSLLPMRFTPQQGALLLTPVSLGWPHSVSCGYLLEYRENSTFDLEGINEAMTFAALFAFELARRTP